MPDTVLYIPPIAFKDYQERLLSYAKMEISDTEESNTWSLAAAACQGMYLGQHAFDASIEREDAAWTQSMSAGAEQLRAGRPPMQEPTGDLMSGEAARTHMRTLLSTGARVRIPLWHSGIWVTIKAPSELELLALDERMFEEKVKLGRSSSGMVFANSGVYQSAYLIDLAFENISETSYHGNNIEGLRKVILQPDYMQLAWGLLCAIYTDGYVYQQPCLVNPLKCLHVETARLNFGKMSYVDDRAFNQFQRDHMRKRNTGSMSELDVKRYQDEHDFQKNAVIDLHEGVKLEFKVPNLEEFLREGRAWVDHSVSLVDQAFDRELTEDERNNFIDVRAGLTVMQQYSHWVKVLVFTKGGKRIEDPETIRNVLSDMAANEEVFQNFFKGIRKYIDSIMLNVHGLPKYKCPRCEKEPSSEQLKEHPAIFPIDLVHTFFTLVGQRIRQILNRRLK